MISEVIALEKNASSTMERKKAGKVTLLGKSGGRVPQSPEEARLEAFSNPSPSRNYEISIDCPDFTSLCPVTGQPDFARIVISYVPDLACVETKSLKLYLGAFRNEASFNEQVVNRILEDLVAAISPRRMTVKGEFAARGGIALSVTASHPETE